MLWDTPVSQASVVADSARDVFRVLVALAGLKSFLRTAIWFEVWLLDSLTAFGLFTTSKTDLASCKESQRQATVAAILDGQFFFLVGTGIDTYADRICFNAVMFVLCCLAQSNIAQLCFRLLKIATLLFKLRHRKRLLLTVTELYSRPASVQSVLFADRRRSATTS